MWIRRDLCRADKWWHPYTGADADHHPVTNVDWCDAYAYCAGVGKRLCGKIGGGTNVPTDYTNANLSQWYNVCSSGGVNAYPYAGAFQVKTCNGGGLSNTTTTVASLTGCQPSPPYAGVYDLSGDVGEWEDSCYDLAQSTACLIRGGSFYAFGSQLSCGEGDASYYSSVYDYAGNGLGFRCCSG